ncbi:MAG TPA: SgcJ/EcaC family oxidoreductase [Bradyrhizobium sp.]
MSDVFKQNQKVDVDAIREVERRFNEAWGRHDADAMVESLVDDAQVVTVNGAWTRSRDLMVRLHGPDGPFRSSTRETPELDIQFMGSDAAVLHTRFHIHGDVDERERNSIGTRILRKIDGRWWTVAVQNTDVRPGRRH